MTRSFPILGKRVTIHGKIANAKESGSLPQLVSRETVRALEVSLQLAYILFMDSPADDSARIRITSAYRIVEPSPIQQALRMCLL